MKIKYDLKGVQYDFYDFIQGVYLNKNRIRKNKVDTLHGFTFHVVVGFVLSFVGFFIGYLLLRNDVDSFFYQTIAVSFILFMILILFSYIAFLFIFLYNKKRVSIGNIILSDEGVSDISEGVSIMMKWDNIDFIAVKEDMIVVMPKNDFQMLTFLTDESNKFVKNAKKYNKDIFIIRFD